MSTSIKNVLKQLLFLVLIIGLSKTVFAQNKEVNEVKTDILHNFSDAQKCEFKLVLGKGVLVSYSIIDPKSDFSFGPSIAFYDKELNKKWEFKDYSTSEMNKAYFSMYYGYGDRDQRRGKIRISECYVDPSGTYVYSVNYTKSIINMIEIASGKLTKIATNANLPYICSVINSNTDLSINQVPAQETIIPIKVKSGTSGLHTISIDNISEYDYLNCIFLEDVFTGTTYNLFNQQSFMVFISDTTTSARFLLHIGTINTLSSIDPSCMEINDGLIVIENNSTTGFETTLTDSEGNILVNNTGVYNTDSIFNLASGIYTIQTNDATCGNISEIVILNEPSLITANFTYTNTALTYTFNNTSQNGISYLWDFGDGSTSTLENPDYTYLSEGTYLVTLTVYQNETCFATTTQWVTIISTGIETVNEVEAKVWINDNALLINTSTEQYETYQIKNTLGQILVSESFHNNNKATATLIV